MKSGCVQIQCSYFAFRIFVGCLFFICPISLTAQWAHQRSPNAANYNVLVFNGDTFFAGTDLGLYVSDDYAQHWKPTGTSGQPYINSIAASGSNVYESYFGGISTSADNGVTWAKANSGLTDLQVNTVAVIGNNVFAGTNGSGIFISNDKAATWTDANVGLTGLYIYCIIGNGSSVIAGTADGIFISEDNGASWTLANGEIVATCLVVQGGYLFAGIYGGGVYRSGDNGSTWKAINVGLRIQASIDQGPKFVPITALAVSGGNIYAGSSGNDGIFISTNAGDSWTNITTDLEDLRVTSIAIHGDSIFLATLNRGIFLRSQLSIVPTITGFSPAAGESGAEVTIEGTNFGLAAANRVVKFNGVKAKIKGTPTATSIVVNVPGGATSGPITVTVDSLSVVSATNFDVTLVTGLNENTTEPALTLFPNPAQRTLEINLRALTTQSAGVQIFDMHGSALAALQMSGSVLSIDISGYAPGSYLVKVQTGARVYHAKFIKL